MVLIDGDGFDWSYMADDEVPINMGLMAFSDSEVHNDKTCSKTYLKSFKTLKTQLDDLRIEFNKSEFNLAAYKRGLASVEEQLVFYKKNEVIFCEQLAILKRDYLHIKIRLACLNLDKLIGSQIPDKSRKGLGFVSYNAVPPPPTGLFSPPNLDLSNSGLEEFQQPEFEGYGPKTSKNVSEDTSNEVRESPDALMVEKLVSDDKLEKKTVFPTVAKIEFVRPKQQEKPVRKLVKYAKMYSFGMYHQRERVESRNNYTRVNYNYSTKKTHPSAHRNMISRAVLMKTGLKAVNTARPVTTAHPKTTVYSARPMYHYSKSAQSTSDVFSQPLSYFDIEDAFSSNFPDYIPASPDYFPASPRNTSSESSNNSSGLVPIASPTLSLFHNDPYMKVMQAYDAISPPQVTIPPPTVVPPSLMLSPMFDSRDFFPPEEIPPPKDTKTPVESPIPISPSSSVGSSSPVRMPPKRTSTSAAPTMTQAAIKKLVADSVSAALEAQVATMANANNTNRNTREREAPVARNNCIKDYKVKFATGTLTEETLSWWNSFAQPIGIEEAYKITWVEFKKLLIKKTYVEDQNGNFCPTYVAKQRETHWNFHRRDYPESIEGNVTASKAS
ncbi:hypothetical protein Tco_1152688 [Tanacetum coccineum]